MIGSLILSLYWAAALHDALPKVSGPARLIVSRFDGQVLKGLSATPGQTSPERIAELEQSLLILAPVIVRLQGEGVNLDEHGLPPADFPRRLSQAVIEVAKETEIRAETVIARYRRDDIPPEDALANSRDADHLLADRYPFLSDATLHRLASIYDSERTERLAQQAGAPPPAQIALVEPEESGTMRDAVAAPSPAKKSAVKKARKSPRSAVRSPRPAGKK